MFGRSSPYFIPHHLYSALTLPSWRPNIHQLAALSRISNYRLCDWLAIFGFHLDDIPRLQPLLARKRTVVLDSSVYDENARIPWFAERLPPERIPGIAPLGYFLRLGPPVRARTLLALRRQSFLYAKLGDDDLQEASCAFTRGAAPSGCPRRKVSAASFSSWSMIRHCAAAACNETRKAGWYSVP
jgi:hypothetical protein